MISQFRCQQLTSRTWGRPTAGPHSTHHITIIIISPSSYHHHHHLRHDHDHHHHHHDQPPHNKCHHHCICHLSTDIFITKIFVWRKGLVSIQVKLTALLAVQVHLRGLSLHDWHIKLPLWLAPVHIYCCPCSYILPHLFANNAHTLLKPGPCSSILPHSYADNVPTLLKLYPLLTYIANINLQRMPLTALKLLSLLYQNNMLRVLAKRCYRVHSYKWI